MPSKHISFVAVPAHGHVNPSLSLVAELVRRGHRVTFAVNGEFAEPVTATGATALRYDSTFPSEADGATAWPEDAVGAQRLFRDEFLAVTQQVERLYADDRPDLVVYDIGAWQAPVLAAKWAVPAVQLSPTYVAYDGWAEDFGIDTAAEPEPEAAAMDAEFARFVAGHGVDLTVEEIKTHPRRCVVTIPSAWQPHGERVAASYSFVGPSVDERAHQGQWLAPDDWPVLLVSLGSAYTDQLEFYRQCVAAVPQRRAPGRARPGRAPAEGRGHARRAAGGAAARHHRPVDRREPRRRARRGPGRGRNPSRGRRRGVAALSRAQPDWAGRAPGTLPSEGPGTPTPGTRPGPCFTSPCSR